MFQVVDLGMGIGKLALQLFCENPHLLEVIGVEKVGSRFDVAKAACSRLCREMEDQMYESSEVSDGAGVDVVCRQEDSTRRLRILR